jgi:hypothetical protein
LKRLSVSGKTAGILIFTVSYTGAWGSVVVKARRHKSEGPGIDSGIAGVFSVTSDSSMCPKNEYQFNPGGKGGRCIRLTTYHLHVLMSRNLGAVTSWNPVGLFRPVMGQLFTVIYRIVLGPINFPQQGYWVF